MFQFLIGKISTGVQNDREKVTKMTYAQYTASVKRLGFFPSLKGGWFWNEQAIWQTASIIDTEVREWVAKAYEKNCGPDQDTQGVGCTDCRAFA